MAGKWTVLIYANGNNELEPEMYRILSDCRQVKVSGEIKILVQIGREKRKLIKILRPQDDLIEYQENWTGVRRYLMKMNKHDSLEPSLVQDLGSLNMAHPKTMYDFLRWGMKAYPAEKYLLLMGGHSFQYLGLMTDYSSGLPYIMGIPELAKALNLVKKTTGESIELLVLDTCYMNMVEILYELAQEKSPCVKNVLTYIEHGPIGGLPVDRLINVIAENTALKDINLLLNGIIDELDFDLVAFNLNQKKLGRIRRLTEDLGRILTRPENKHLRLGDIWEDTENDALISQNVHNLKKGLEGLIIYSKRITNQKSRLLDIAHKPTSNKLAAYYTRLSFAKGNYWSKLLGVEYLKEALTLEDSKQLKPLILPLQALVSLIAVMNPGADDKVIEGILGELVSYKKWQHFNNIVVK